MTTRDPLSTQHALQQMIADTKELIEQTRALCRGSRNSILRTRASLESGYYQTAIQRGQALCDWDNRE